MSMLKPVQIHLHLGLEKPVRILHLTDPHLSIADDKDIEWCMERAAHRRNVFFKEAEFPERDPVGYLEDAMEYAKNFDCTVITGDLFDHAFHGSEVIAKKILAGKDYLFCAGNHEYYKYIAPNVFEPDLSTFRQELQDCFRGDMFFESRIVGGVNIVTADNATAQWDKALLPKLEAEVAKGLPILLFCHCPLNDRMRSPEYDLKPGVPVSDEVRQKHAISAKIVNYIAEEPLFKATFAGHYHFTTTESLNGKTTYILGGLFKGIVGEILID
ncbi:MAG: metallophosphoesterase [Clostridia bacterium]|nr:metallophosphoesterase [Clostridia bacterium]